MSTEVPSKVKVVPKLVKLENGMKLAESWVSKMSGSADDESTELEVVGRPARLGLGAKGTIHSRLEASTDPIEKRLRAKLEAGKRRAGKKIEDELNPSERKDDEQDSDDDDEDTGSRTNAFTKKKVGLLSSSLQAKKKRR